MGGGGRVGGQPQPSQPRAVVQHPCQLVLSGARPGWESEQLPASRSTEATVAGPDGSVAGSGPDFSRLTRTLVRDRTRAAPAQGQENLSWSASGTAPGQQAT